MFQGFFAFATWEDRLLVIVVPVFLLLAGGGLLMAWLKRKGE